MVTIVTQHLSDPYSAYISSLKNKVGRRANYKSLLYASMSVNDKVAIRWLTEDGWKGSEQTFIRRQFFMPIYGRKMFKPQIT